MFYSLLRVLICRLARMSAADLERVATRFRVHG